MKYYLRKQRPLILILTALALLLSFAGRPALAAEETEIPACEGSEETVCGSGDETDTEEVPEETVAAEEEEPPTAQDVLPDVPEDAEDGEKASPVSETEKETESGTGEETEPCETPENEPVEEDPAGMPPEESAIQEMPDNSEPAAVPEAAAQVMAEPAGDDKTPASGEETGTDTPSVVQVTVVKESGEEFKMFKARSSTATLNGDRIDIVFETANVSFDKIYIGGKNDAEKTDYFTGTRLEDGGFRFVFSVDKALNGTNTEIALGKTDGTWYQNMTLYLVIPQLEEPETPEQPEEPVVQVTVVKESGEEFKMFKAQSSTATLNGDRIDIVFETANVSFDKIYLGSKDDEEKTEYYTGTQLENGGFRFEFSVDRALNGTRTEVALGKTDGTWYKNMTLYLVIPDLEEPQIPDGPSEPGEPENPDTPDDPSGQEEPMISEEGVLADGIYSAQVETGQAMFKVVDCVITSEDGKMTAVITLSGTGYDYLYLGSGKEAYAADGEGWIPFQEDPETGKYTYTLELASVTETVSVAARSARYASEGRGEAAWLDRTLTFVPESITKIADLPDEEDPAEPSEPSNPSDEPGTGPAEGGEGKDDGSGNEGTTAPGKDATENTGTQDEDEIRKMEENTKKGTVADGTYVPSFGFTGGTGKVTISCPKLVVKNGKGTATLVFSSSKYTYIQVNGTKYYNENPGGKSTFTIPVNVNGTTYVSAETTAMSEAHVIDYVLYIYVDGQDVSNIRPSSASEGAETDTEKDAAENTDSAEEEEEFGTDGKRNGNSGWGEYDSIQTPDEPESAEETAVPATGAEDTVTAPETEEPSGTRGFSAWYGVGIGAAVVALAAGGIAALRKGKKRT